MNQSLDPTPKTRVALFYDVNDWAFHNVAKNIQRIAPKQFEITIFAREDWFGVPGESERILSSTDTAIFLWRFDLLAYLDSLNESGWQQLKQPGRCTFIVLVYDHIYCEKKDLDALGDPFKIADGVATSSARLGRHYNSASHLPQINHCVPDGVDLGLFSPAAMDAAAPTQPLRIGWVGNSDWGATLGHDFKGKTTVLDPALERLRKSGLPFTVHIADKAKRRVPHEEMPEFYRNIDVLVCCSVFEGTPNPVLEAMAVGCAVVSTDVGIVPEIFGPLQMQFLMGKQGASELASLLERLIHEPETLTALKNENLKRRATLGWHTRWPAWQELLEDSQKNASTGQSAARALESFRTRRKSKIAHVRKIIATNRVAFRVYSLILVKMPGLIRWGKRVLSGGER